MVSTLPPSLPLLATTATTATAAWLVLISQLISHGELPWCEAQTRNVENNEEILTGYFEIHL